MTREPPDDNDIARLLSDLKDKTPGYPPELLAHRRAAYEQGMAGLGIGLVAAEAAKGGAAAGGTATGGAAAGGAAAGGAAAGGAAAGGAAAVGAWSIETILKVLIVTALVVEGVGGAVLYRQRLLHRNVPPPTSSLTATLPSPTSTPSLSATPSVTPSVTPSATLTFALTPLFTSGPGSGNPPTDIAPSNTPAPNIPTRTPRGHHFGQTPTPPPQRTPTEGTNGQ
jgi:hypothetical protein